MERLDVFLVNHHYVESRSRASYLIRSGKVQVNQCIVTKRSYSVSENDQILVEDIKYVSRGGLKLEKALSCFSISLRNKKMLDIGSSTGGFCDVALQNGIEHIVAVDVGNNQFSSKLLESHKIELFENTDIRSFDLASYVFDVVTIDVSFISLLKILPYIPSYVPEVVCLIKPQFECGKQAADQYHGVVLNQEIHLQVLNRVVSHFQQYGFYLNGITYSPIRGASGNIEYLAYFTKNKKEQKLDFSSFIREAFSLR